MSRTRSEFAGGAPALGSAFLGLAVGISSLFFYTIGVFIRPLQSEFGWSRAELSLATLISGIVLAVMSPLVGRITDRLGARLVALVSMPALAAGAFLVSFATSRLWLYLPALALLCLLGAGTSPVVFTRLIATRFHRARGLALGIALSGMGMVGAIAPPLLTPFVATHGWRAGYRLLAVVVLIAVPLVLAGAGPRSGSAGTATSPTRSISIVDLLRYRSFRLITATTFLVAIAVGGLVVHFVPMLQDAGLNATTAGRTAGLIGLAVIGSRLGSGALIDRIHAPYVGAALFAIAASGCVLLVIGGVGMAPVAALLIGAALGAEVDLVGFLVARYLGLRVYGSAYGVAYGAFIAGSASGPFLVGLCYDATRSYRLALFCAAASLFAAALLLLRMGPYPDTRIDGESVPPFLDAV